MVGRGCLCAPFRAWGTLTKAQDAAVLDLEVGASWGEMSGLRDSVRPHWGKTQEDISSLDRRPHTAWGGHEGLSEEASQRSSRKDLAGKLVKPQELGFISPAFAWRGRPQA